MILQIQKATGFDLVHCEQIATIAHTKGKAVVKSGDMVELEPIKYSPKGKLIWLQESNKLLKAYTA